METKELAHGSKQALQIRPSAELVSLSGVRKVYGGNTYALHDIELDITRGEIIAICGPGGSGKTSLLHIVGMLEAATEGSVVLAGLLVSKLSEQARADLRNDMLGFVFQSFSLIPVLTARENVLLPMLLRAQLGESELAAAQARADTLLAAVGLAPQAAYYPPRLDPGQCQRVAIARALINQPRLVIADEPTSRQDSCCTRMIMDLFAEQQAACGTTFLISTRDQRQLSRVTRTLQLADGRLQSTPGSRRPLQVQP
ncbi:ABC transporter ATP-binding protein [Massilia sp. PAMC28688]|uniref:ABC transporter ATP-binding protein n=1 Tax=Massilia sp. PAMC28688 TaxID=2861283 RepID=UPI001C63A124|nr:ABC transporter ATP-binding protein [Massilia sp. PAMC28688]QYF95207.1 ABC transporter ATP-binding protein [Massilia sp. PAMC28688]